MGLQNINPDCTLSGAMKFLSSTLFLLLVMTSAAEPASADTLHFYFDINKSEITEAWLENELNTAGWNSDYMLAREVRVSIKAYTDCPGSVAYNQRLSERRAKAA